MISDDNLFGDAIVAVGLEAEANLQEFVFLILYLT